MKRFNTLDSLRGIAALMIVLFHSPFHTQTIFSNFIKHSSLFVDMFFILSGFVMAHSYINRIRKGLSFRYFFIKRLSRLYPLHIVTLFIWLFLISMKYYLFTVGVEPNNPFKINNLDSFIANIFLLQGFLDYTSWNYPSWSISLEFYIYILFFILYRYLKVNYILLCTFLFIIYLSIIYEFFDIHIVQRSFQTILEFFLGVVLYKLYTLLRVFYYNRIILTIFETILIVLLIYSISEYDNSIFKFTTILILFMGITLIFSFDKKGLIGEFLTNQKFVFIGKISYSIYMIHALLLVIFYKIIVNILHLEQVVDGSKSVESQLNIIINSIIILIIIYISKYSYIYIEKRGREMINSFFGIDR